jgi:hypothetical protein
MATFQIVVHTPHTTKQFRLRRSDRGDEPIITLCSIPARAEFGPQPRKPPKRSTTAPTAAMSRCPVDMSTGLAHEGASYRVEMTSPSATPAYEIRPRMRCAVPVSEPEPIHSECVSGEVVDFLPWDDGSAAAELVDIEAVAALDQVLVAPFGCFGRSEGTRH